MEVKGKPSVEWNRISRNLSVVRVNSRIHSNSKDMRNPQWLPVISWRHSNSGNSKSPKVTCANTPILTNLVGKKRRTPTSEPQLRHLDHSKITNNQTNGRKCQPNAKSKDRPTTSEMRIITVVKNTATARIRNPQWLPALLLL
jgi:hypothetical protein